VGHGTWSRISVLELGGWLVILVTFDWDTELESLPPIVTGLVQFGNYFIHHCYIVWFVNLFYIIILSMIKEEVVEIFRTLNLKNIRKKENVNISFFKFSKQIFHNLIGMFILIIFSR
jgi:hypothetical protein